MKLLVIGLFVILLVIIGGVFAVSKLWQANQTPARPLTGNEAIQVVSPRPNDTISSPLKVLGKARGSWYFEASFPVRLLDANGKELAVISAKAKDDWMTNDFVSFEAELNFSAPTTETGTLVLEKSNPSGLPENADKIEISVRFAKAGGAVGQKTCIRTGCGGEVCSDKEEVSICILLPEDQCYSMARCEVQADGNCGWTETPEFVACLKNLKKNQ